MSKISKVNYKEYINQYFAILETNFSKKIAPKDKIPMNKAFEMIEDLNIMMSALYEKEEEYVGNISKHVLYHY